MKTWRFTVSDRDAKLIAAITTRAIIAAREANWKYDRLDCTMDLTACHANCCLDLNKLLQAPDFDFAHDVCGIYRHLDRRTGQLQDCFVPRCAKKG